MTDSADRFDWMHRSLQSLDQADRRRVLRGVDREGVWLRFPDGHRALNFGANDYLGLAATNLSLPAATPTHRPDAAADAASESAVARGSGASALVCGWTTLHETLASQLAAFEETEAAVLFPAGYAACSGCIATLAQQGDLILSDALNHASLIDGCRLSKAERFVYAHRDVTMVEALLKHHRHRFRRCWIVTDSVFSMDGTLAPLRELVPLADRFDATLIVDEAHATGVLGDDGSGACAALGVKDRVPIRIGTLSKAIGSQGGFVVGPQVVIDFLINHARSLIYSTAAAPATVAAALAALHALRHDPQPRQRLQRRARELRRMLSELGFALPRSSELEATIPILPIRIGESAATMSAAEQLFASGCYVPGIRPPTVPQGTGRLRITLSAAHEEAHCTRLTDALAVLTP